MSTSPLAASRALSWASSSASSTRSCAKTARARNAAVVERKACSPSASGHRIRCADSAPPRRNPGEHLDQGLRLRRGRVEGRPGPRTRRCSSRAGSARGRSARSSRAARRGDGASGLRPEVPAHLPRGSPRSGRWPRDGVGPNHRGRGDPREDLGSSMLVRGPAGVGGSALPRLRRSCSARLVPVQPRLEPACAAQPCCVPKRSKMGITRSTARAASSAPPSVTCSKRRNCS